MQTFLPGPDFYKIGMTLDKLRLLNQFMRESPILLTAIESYDEFPLENKTPWSAHPAARMWQGYAREFCFYNSALAEAARERFPSESGHIDMWCRYWKMKIVYTRSVGKCPWLGWERLHQSHRANLIRKNPDYYSRRLVEKPMEGYSWPVHFKEGVLTFEHPEEWLLDYRLPLPEVWVMALKERLF